MNGSNSNTSGSKIATVTPEKKTGSDCISDERMQEIARRIKVTIESEESDIWGGTEEPEDKSDIWWPRDPLTGARIGQPKIYDPVTETWIPLGTVTLPAQPKRRRRNGLFFVAAGSGAQEITFDDLGTEDYHISLTMTRKIGGNFIAASASMVNFGVQIVGMTASSFTAHFFAVPVDGFGVMWEVQTNQEFTN